MEVVGARAKRASQAALVFLLLFSVTVWPPAVSNAQNPAPPEEATVSTDVEAWYYVADKGVAPAPLPAIPDPFSPYGENTLHVSITGGSEDARTYVTLDTTALPTIFELVEGTRELPIDLSGVTIGADTSRVQVCLATPPPESAEGSFEEPPDVDCSTRTPATYKAEPYPHLLADITDFGADLSFSALAVVPSDRAKEQSDTWHVTFYGKKNDTENARPITAHLTFVEPESPFDVDDGLDTGTSTPPDFSSGGSSVGGFDTSTGPSFDVGAAPGEEVAAQQPVGAATPAPTEELGLASDETRAPYTIVWALPLLLLAFGSYFSSALTRSIVIRRESPSP
jgi:hypothetical protein